MKYKNKPTSNIPTSNLKPLTSNSAITLIALIITVIVLLILAGITLNMVMGDNGIIKKVQLAKDKTNEAQQEESEKLSELEDEIDNKVNGSFVNDNDEKELEKYKKAIANTLTNLGVKTLETQTIDEYIKNIDILADKNYKEGEDSNIVLIKSNLSSRYEQTLSLSNVEGYQNFDDDDFIIVNKNMLCENRNDWEDILTITKKFDKKTGTLILGKQKSYASRNSWTFWNTYDLYAIKRDVKEIETEEIKINSAKENLEEFKRKIAKTIEKYGSVEDTISYFAKKYGIKNNQDDILENKTEEEISEYIKTIAKNKFKEGISTYMVLVKDNLSTRYNQNVNVSNLEGYQNLTIDDFLIVNKNISFEGINDYVEVQTMTKEYNANTGILEFGMQKSFSDIWTFWNTYDVYVIKKKIINLEN